MIKRENLTKPKTTNNEKEQNKQITLAKKTGVLRLSCFSLNKWPSQIFTFAKLTLLDLSYNNLEDIPLEIKLLQDLNTLYLNNNPIQSVPIELSECKKLRTIDLSDTNVKWLPREMAKLKFLSDINLKNCPLKGNLEHSYQMGVNTLMKYFERKYDRSIYREHLVKFLKEWIYVNNTREEIQQSVEFVWKALKDVETKHLKRLLKNAQYLFPKRIEELDAHEIREKLLASFEEKNTLMETNTQTTQFKKTDFHIETQNLSKTESKLDTKYGSKMDSKTAMSP